MPWLIYISAIMGKKTKKSTKKKRITKRNFKDAYFTIAEADVLASIADFVTLHNLWDEWRSLPSYSSFYEDGTKKYESWKRRGKLHRTDGPAMIEYHPNGVISHKRYYINDMLYCPPDDPFTNPSHVMYYSDGTVAREEWYVGNMLHCLDGPAWKMYKSDGTIDREEWYINSLSLTMLLDGYSLPKTEE